MPKPRIAIELESLAEVQQHLSHHRSLHGVVVQDVDLRPLETELCAAGWAGMTLLGCRLSVAAEHRAIADGALIFPRFTGLPFSPYRATLYQVDELYDVFDPAAPQSYEQCLDARVYRHWKSNGGAHAESIVETLARRLHDHAITDAMEEFIDNHGHPRQVVAIMGGHGMARSHGSYKQVALMARRLTRAGFVLASGGGPGAMEATHLGSYLAACDDDALTAAIDVLTPAPCFDHPEWLAAAFRVRQRWPLSEVAAAQCPSLGIPTWLYGHEPPNAFATHIAKYFANSVREDGLLAIAKHGVVYAPGSAGTIQEVFQDACQNHYVTAGVVSPMVFLDQHYWTHEKPVYPLLKQLAAGREYHRWLSITDAGDEAVERIIAYRDATTG